MSAADETAPIHGFMCRTDYEYELGEACGGSKVYPSLHDIKLRRECVRGCGIVEVEVKLVRIVEPGHDHGEQGP